LSLRDWSGFGNHGVLNNMDPSGDWILSRGQYGLDFDGSNDQVTVAAAGSGPLFSVGSGDFAVSLHASLVSGSYRALIGNQTGFANGMLFGRNTSELGAYLGNSTEMNSGVSVPVDGSWNHYGIQRLGTTISFWKNGVQAPNTFTRAQSMAGTVPTTIGAATAYSPWLGPVDDVRFYSRALAANEWRGLASRRGIAYELAPRRRSRVFGGFRAAWAARKAQIIGGGL
jgi:hypothetical protein